MLQKTACEAEAFIFLHSLLSLEILPEEVLGWILYDIFSTDFTESKDTLTATYADYSVTLATNTDPEDAPKKVQQHVGLVEKVEESKLVASKSVQTTLTLKKKRLSTENFNWSIVYTKNQCQIVEDDA